MTEADELRGLLVELAGNCNNYDLDSDDYAQYVCDNCNLDADVETIVIHPNFTNDSELDSRMSKFKDMPSSYNFLALQGAMIVYHWLNS